MDSHVYPNPAIITTTATFQQFIQTPPTFEEALTFLRAKYGDGLSESLVREWYEFMEVSCWSNPQGHPYRNWPRSFYVWKANYAKFAALRAVPEQPHSNGRTPPRADNYIRASEETIRKFREGFI